MEENKEKKFNDTSIKIADNVLDVHDIEHIYNIEQHAGKTNVYLAKVAAYKEKEENKNSGEIDYVGFEIPSNTARSVLENLEQQKNFINYVVLYYIYSKRDNKNNRLHYLGNLVEGEDQHFTCIKNAATEKIFIEYIKKLEQNKNKDDER